MMNNLFLKYVKRKARHVKNVDATLEIFINSKSIGTVVFGKGDIRSDRIYFSRTLDILKSKVEKVSGNGTGLLAFQKVMKS